MNNEQEKIENWVTEHLKTNFIYYVLACIFFSIFSLLFYSNVNNPSLIYLLAVSFFPSIIVTLLTYVLLREYFFLFFVLLILITPVSIVVVVVFILTNEAPVSGYVIYTNNLTNKCKVEILDHSKGIPWYTSKGCVINSSDKNIENKNKRITEIKKYIKLGGNGRKWSSACSSLDIFKGEFDRDYKNILNNNHSFSLNNSYSIDSDEYKLIKKVSVFRNTTRNTIADFKGNVPDIKIDDLFTLCEVDPVVAGGIKVFN